MSQENRFLQGPLKHARAAALAAALVPLASVAATSAEAQRRRAPPAVCATSCLAPCSLIRTTTAFRMPATASSEALLSPLMDPPRSPTRSVSISSRYATPGTYTIAVQIPPGTQPSPANVGSDDTIDSDGERDTRRKLIASRHSS